MTDTRMSREQREAFLAAPRIGVLSIPRTAEEHAPPLTAPVWYDYNPDGDKDRQLWFLTGPNSAKGKLLNANGRVTMVAQQEAMPYAYVSVECTVTDIREATDAESRHMADRYLGTEMGAAYVRANEGSVSIKVSLRTDRWLTVDYAKISL